MDKFMQVQVLFLMMSLAISFVLTYFLGLWGLIPAITLFLLISYILRRRQMKMYGSGSSGGFNFGAGGGGVKFECIGCGHKHNKGQCPRCGSKMRKAAW